MATPRFDAGLAFARLVGMGMKPFVAMALLLAACAPEVSAVRTTTAYVPNARAEWKPRAEAPPARVDTLEVTNVGVTPQPSNVHQAPAVAQVRPSGSASLVLGAIVLLPFIFMPSSNNIVGLSIPPPTFAPASNLPSGELPSTVEIVSTVNPEPTVTMPQTITTPPTVVTPETSTTARTVFGIPLSGAWTP